MCLPPIERNKGVSNWQSMKCAPSFFRNFAKWINASFEALGTRENILSPKNALFKNTP
jgi:hypothetical protein